MTDAHPPRPRGAARLIGWIKVAWTFNVELTLATWDTIRVILTPNERLRPAILAVPLDARSPEAITLFASMVTLTPGTTSIDVSEDQKTLYVHVLNADDHDAVISAMKGSLETRAREVYP